MQRFRGNVLFADTSWRLSTSLAPGEHAEATDALRCLPQGGEPLVPVQGKGHLIPRLALSALAALCQLECAAERLRSVARQLQAMGLTGRDIAVVLGVSPQRVSQLLASSGRRWRRPKDLRRSPHLKRADGATKSQALRAHEAQGTRSRATSPLTISKSRRSSVATRPPAPSAQAITAASEKPNGSSA